MNEHSLLAGILESAMMAAFGMAWPANILKNLRSRTTAGKSIVFLLIIFVAYLCGIAAKLAGEQANFVLAFYMLNLVLVGIDITLYYRNYKLDKARAAACAACAQIRPE